MIGSLILFLGSAGYLAGRAACSHIAKTQINTHVSNSGINIQRQMELERMSIGATQYDRSHFLDLLKKADLSKTSMESTHEKKRRELLEKYDKFETYSRLNKDINSFYDMISIEDRNYSVWIIAQSEGWIYNKGMIHGLPNYCYGYEMHKDSYIKSRASLI